MPCFHLLQDQPFSTLTSLRASWYYKGHTRVNNQQRILRIVYKPDCTEESRQELSNSLPRLHLSPTTSECPRMGNSWKFQPLCNFKAQPGESSRGEYKVGWQKSLLRSAHCHIFLEAIICISLIITKIRQLFITLSFIYF